MRHLCGMDLLTAAEGKLGMNTECIGVNRGDVASSHAKSSAADTKEGIRVDEQYKGQKHKQGACGIQGLGEWRVSTSLWVVT